MGSGAANGLGYAAGGLSSGLMDGMKMGEMMAQKRGQKAAGGAERLWANQPQAQPQQPPQQPAPGVGGFSPDAQQPQAQPAQQQPSGGAPAQPTQAGGGEISTYIAQKAKELGIDPNVALRVASSEGLRSKTPGQPGDQNTSFGPFQLHYGGQAQGALGANGLGDEFTKSTGLDARDPKTWKQQVDFSLAHAKQNGWGAWNGAKNTGIDNWAGIHRGGVQPASYTPDSATPQQAKTDTSSDSASSRKPFGQSMPLEARVKLVRQLPKPMQQQAVSGNLPPAGSGPLDLKTSVKLIQKAYPGASDRDIFNATQDLLPFMNQDAAAGYKAMQLQLMQERVTETAGHNRAEEVLRNDADTARKEAADANIKLKGQAEEDKVKYENTKEYRLGQELQVKIQALQDKEDQAKADMEIKRKKLTLSEDATTFKRNEADYKKAQDLFKNTQKQREDAEKAISSMAATGASTNPDNAGIVKADQAIANAPAPQVPGAGGAPPAASSSAPPAADSAAKPIPPDYAAKIKQAMSSGVDKEKIKQAVIADGYDPAALGL